MKERGDYKRRKKYIDESNRILEEKQRSVDELRRQVEELKKKKALLKKNKKRRSSSDSDSSSDSSSDDETASDSSSTSSSSSDSSSDDGKKNKKRLMEKTKRRPNDKQEEIDKQDRNKSKKKVTSEKETNENSKQREKNELFNKRKKRKRDQISESESSKSVSSSGSSSSDSSDSDSSCDKTKKRKEGVKTMKKAMPNKDKNIEKDHSSSSGSSGDERKKKKRNKIERRELKENVKQREIDDYSNGRKKGRREKTWRAEEKGLSESSKQRDSSQERKKRKKEKTRREEEISDDSSKERDSFQERQKRKRENAKRAEQEGSSDSSKESDSSRKRKKRKRETTRREEEISSDSSKQMDSSEEKRKRKKEKSRRVEEEVMSENSRERDSLSERKKRGRKDGKTEGFNENSMQSDNKADSSMDRIKRKGDKKRTVENLNEKENGVILNEERIKTNKDVTEQNNAPNENNRTNEQKKDPILTRTGGAYIPPARLRLMQAQISDKSSEAYQRISFEALKKSLNGLINKVNTSNIAIIAREMFQENIVRGRGIFCRHLMQAQTASPTFTNVYAAFASIVNSKFPDIGELLVHRLIIRFKRGFKSNNKKLCVSSLQFIAHLINQQMTHEVIALEILTLLLENPTNDSVEVAVGFLKEVGMKLSQVTPRGTNAIFDRLRHILHEAVLDKRVQYMIEVMFHIRKDHFVKFPSVINDLDLIEEEDQITHLITLDETTTTQDILDVFKVDPNYEENEEKYIALRKEILDDEETSDDDDGDGESEEEDESEDDNERDDTAPIIDKTETNLVSLRRTIFLTIQSSLGFEECAHKLIKLNLKPGQEVELCHMVLDCCAQQRTYEKFYGLLAQRFCQINRNKYQQPFETIFGDTYDTVHRLETNKLRNVAKFFAHLLVTDAVDWEVLKRINLNEEDTTSSSRIFIKILFQEIAEYMGLPKLNERCKDTTLSEALSGLFPRDNPKNTRFAINFFTTIGLGGLTDELRNHLKVQSKHT